MAVPEPSGVAVQLAARQHQEPGGLSTIPTELDLIHREQAGSICQVALVGGGALIVRGVVERPTADLDYFATSSRDVDRLLPALEARLEGEGLRTRRVQHDPSGSGRLADTDGIAGRTEQTTSGIVECGPPGGWFRVRSSRL